MSNENRPDAFVQGSAPAYDEAAVQFGALFRHYKGSYYLTIGIARASTNAPGEGARKVVYHSIPTRDAEAILEHRMSGSAWLHHRLVARPGTFGAAAQIGDGGGEMAERLASEFLDGRFQKPRAL